MTEDEIDIAAAVQQAATGSVPFGAEALAFLPGQFYRLNGQQLRGHFASRGIRWFLSGGRRCCLTCRLRLLL